MSIDNSTVKKIAKLSKLEIDSTSENKMRDELNNILEWVDTLQQVNTDKTEPMLSVFNESMPFREDKVEIDNNQNDILSNAPEKNSGFFVVPKVIE
tara:strand:+ start:7139 stop:7426 length:288 start_codon:yes stop_codon:yes gene_type:complete